MLVEATELVQIANREVQLGGEVRLTSYCLISSAFESFGFEMEEFES